MTQPNSAKKSIVALLVEEQLSGMSQARIYLAIFINVGSDHPGTGFVVEIEDAAFPDVDVESDVLDRKSVV